MPETRPLSSPLSLGPCTPAEWPALLARLDAEFVRSRGRSGSLAERFPVAVGEAFCGNVIVARQDNAAVSCCIVREFDWVSGDAQWRGAMIGLVFTAPEARGRGFAPLVLEEALRVLKLRDVDFAVLWSGLGHFYEGLGWLRHDRGVFGALELAPAAQDIGLHALEGLSLEAQRRREASWSLPRERLAWQANPLPAARTVCLQPEGSHDAYILLGQLDGVHYVHEVVGPAATYPALWQLACANATRVYANEVLGSPFHRWLAQNTAMRFTGQSLAHWRIVSHRARRAPWRLWSLPWFDRI